MKTNTRNTLFNYILLASLVCVLSACSNRTPTPQPPAPSPPNNTDNTNQTPSPAPSNTTEPEIEISVIAENLEVPWDVAQTPEGRIFITERDRGEVSEILEDGTRRVLRRLSVDNRGEGGLLGLTLSPHFSDDGYIYVYYTTSEDNRVVRFQEDGEFETVLTGIPRGNIHNGGRIAFGPDAMLYVATGDAGNQQSSQDLSSLAGKILRLTPGGEPAPDNPIADSPVYALGLRNVQGLAWNEQGQLFATDFGPARDDEVNVIRPGENYGWPHATGVAEDSEYTDPVVVRQPPEASWSGATFLINGAISAWEGSLFVASLRGQRLWRFTFSSQEPIEVIEDESLYEGEYGRLRHVYQANDGSLWLLTSNRDGRGSPRASDDRILRVGPRQ